MAAAATAVAAHSRLIIPRSSSRPPVVTQVRPPSPPPLLPSFLSPAFHLRSSSSPRPRATWPSQYSSIYIEKINIWASSGSFARAVNKPGLRRPGFSSPPPRSLKPLLVLPFRSPFVLAPAAINVAQLPPPPPRSAAFFRHARMALILDCSVTSFSASFG